MRRIEFVGKYVFVMCY